MYKKPGLRKVKAAIKKNPRKVLKDSNDDLFRRIIYARDKKVCQLAGKDDVKCSNVIQCAHIISRVNFRLRWDLQNAVCLCHAHHFKYTIQEYLWWDIVREHFPEKWRYVDKLKNQLTKTDTATLKNVNLYLKQQALAFGVENV